ncbi:classical arabinogalactan protein 9-like [Miscanthus floridulus]|uniref:classical arabinogalactan protein 9-like n=1 Tax=Miscanthus floridulus TaxID=154761 RepID=UPI003458D772
MRPCSPHPADEPPPLRRPRTAARPSRRAPITFARRPTHTGMPPPAAPDTVARQRSLPHARRSNPAACAPALSARPRPSSVRPQLPRPSSPHPRRASADPNALPAPDTIGD